MRPMTMFIATIAFATLALPATAQDDRPERPNRGERGQRFQRVERLDPEQARAAWELQAATVAREIGAADDVSKQIVATYVAARADMAQAVAEAIADRRDRRRSEIEGDRGDDGGDARGRRGRGGDRARGLALGIDREMVEAHRAKLRTALASHVTDTAKLDRAMASLGAFNRSWDNMAHALNELSLETTAAHAAHSAVERYVVALTRVRESDDRESRRDAMRDARETLEDELEHVLDESQMESFRDALGGRGARGDMSRRLLEFDANGDGKLQKSEAPARLLEIFDRMDRNGDGELDASEMGRGPRRGRGGQLPDIF